MTRATGVESSHRRVVPRTDEISRWWMILDALNPPNMYTKVPIALANVANKRSPLYPRIYLMGNFQDWRQRTAEIGLTE